ncbi:tRNA uridine-5-carboxymethylaminomethyl(34) synthesis GTPase MnmE [Methylocapsa aurea]|uniref:tRNA uridine-5-carboxymethylaminomethyl(34) synthesis GTPase MnmE n=1 Tax=Methylocapsa aurea TaxID=663610 RepID=UPI00056AE466|nr:tRNA uridine-5-carboxymethylaminomethyl(34) synthesis GTPase MnmE [Methylocapsa aurea]
MERGRRGNETIFAIASGMSRAAIAVLRLSGPGTPFIVTSLIGSLPEPRMAQLATFVDPVSGQAIDRGLALFFPAPRSFTGEDCAEFHVHGGRAVVAAMIGAIGGLPSARPAEPGEFTRRALLHGKMDLAEVEGLADLIDAETEWQRRQALRQMQGSLGRQTALWRGALIEAAALIEAEIDFSDEGDVPAATSRRIGALLAPVLAGLKAELAAGRAGERIREGLTIVIAGPPNAGKSTLLNALARRDVAIVSPLAGTTRDSLEVHLDLGGCPVTLIDTAGLRESADALEQIGVARALEKANAADLVLWLSEARRPVEPAGEVAGKVVRRIFTKSDLADQYPAAADGLCISAETGENLDVLTRDLTELAQSLTGNGYAGLITQERHRKVFEDAAEDLARILTNLDAPVELLAEDLRSALFSLQRITGLVDVEDILDEIFSRFCIGK